MAKKEATKPAKKEDDLELGAPAGGSKKKLIIIIAAVVLVLAVGGGAAAWFLLGKKGEEAKDAHAPAKEEPAHGKDEKGEKHPPTYQDLKTFVVNLPGNPKTLQVGLTVRFEAAGLGDFLTHNDPALRNAVLNLLSGQDGPVLKTREGKEKLREAIKTQLNELIEKYKGHGEIDEVFYTAFVMQ